MTIHASKTMLAATIAAGILAAPAGAAINSPPAGGHGILSFPMRDFVTGTGYTPGQDVTVNVLRNGVVIGSSVARTGADGVLLVNHPGNPGDLQNCWGNATPGAPSTPANKVPDVMAGDTIQMLTAPGTGDQILTQNVVVTSPATDVAGTIVVQGTAVAADGVSPLPIGSLQQRMIGSAADRFGVNGKRDIRAPGEGTLTYPDAIGPLHWTATYAGLSAADRTRAVNAESRMLWLGATPLAVNDLTLFEFGQVGGPTVGCQGTLALNALTSTDRSIVNAANVTAPLTVSGMADAGITVDVAVPGGAAVAATMTPAAGGQQTWTATIPATDLAAQPDGAVPVTATFTGAGAPGPDTRAITKDTVAPAAPTATPAPGTYAIAQSVGLSDADATAAVHYTADGTAPTAASTTFASPVSVTATQTIKAIAIDPAGNASTVAALGYVIAPLAPSAPGASAPSGPASAPGSSSAGTQGSNRPLSLGSLTVQHRIRRASLKRDGLRLVMRLPAGTQVIKIVIYRITHSGRRLVSAGYRAPSSAGLYRARLTDRALLRELTVGRYELAVTPGASRQQLGTTATYAVQVVS